MPITGRSSTRADDAIRSNNPTHQDFAKDDDSSSSSSTSSDSTSGSGSSDSRSSCSSSSSGTSVECILVRRPLNSPNHVRKPCKLQSNHIDSSLPRESGGKAKILTPVPHSTATSGLADNLTTFDVDDNDFTWFDNTNENENEPFVEDGVDVQSFVPGAASNRSVAHNDAGVRDDDLSPPSSKETPIGPVSHSERKAELDSLFYAPPPYHHKQPPIVHHLSLGNRPAHVRKHISVSQLFDAPVAGFWRGKFDKFNHLQSEVSSLLVDANDTVVVSAPTSAGKTAIFEMAMARHISCDLEVLRESLDWRQKQLPSSRKMVYISPSKALCDERYDDWSRRLSDLKLGIRTAMITGDAEPGEAFRDIANSHLILTTPEKWDSLTRRWNENFVIFGSVKLVLVDEIHLLGDSSRGSCLESVLCRMKTIFRATQACGMTQTQINTSSFVHTTPSALASHLRFVAVSATLPNIGDIASFLNANEAFAFDDSYRPVPLTTHVAACGDAGNNKFMFNKSMNHRVPGVIRQFSKGKSTIIFCHTKKETELLASELAQLGDLGLPGNNPRLAGQASVSGLQRCLLRGVAYHNAGLDTSDRKLVEKAFLEGDIKFLCATSTLAVGVNLPAHLVIIKGTSAWRGADAGYSEVEKESLLQMIGRAGRVGFDTSGTAVIMTESKYEGKYRSLGASLENVQSKLLPKLVQVLNTEISQKVITTFQHAKDWLATTFLFQRIKANPSDYGIHDDRGLEHCLTQIVGVELKKLEDVGCVEISKHQNGDVTPLFACHVMSQQLVDFQTMKRIIELPFACDAGQLLATISLFEGLHKPVRRSEKKILNEVHKAVKYKLDGPPSKVRIQEPHQKAFILLQAAIGQHYFDDFTLRQEMSANVELSTRMLAAAEDYSVYGSKNGHIALQSLKLRRSLAVSLWGSGDGVMNQLRGVGQEATGRLRFNNISSFHDVLNAQQDVIEKAAGRTAPFGSELRKAVYAILRNSLKLTAQVSEDQWVTCQLSRNDKIPNDAFSDGENQSVTVKYTLLAFTDQPNGCLFFQSNVDEPGEFRFRCPEAFRELSVHLVSSLVGLDEVVTIVGNEEAAKGLSEKRNPQDKGTPEAKTTQDVIETRPEGHTPNRSKKRVRDPKGSLRDGFKRQHDSNKSTPKRSPSVAVTPSPFAAAVQGRPSSFQAQAAHSSKRDKPLGIASPGSASSRLAQRESPPFGQDDRVSQVCFPRRAPHQSSAYRSTARGDTATISDGRNLDHHRLAVRPAVMKPESSSSPRWDWARQKREQGSRQTSAFRTKHENPFAKFQYDPNDAENNLDAITNENSAAYANTGSILPPDVFIKGRASHNVFHKGPTRMRSKRGSVRTRGFGTATQGIPSHMVLRMKGEEQMRQAGLQFPPMHQSQYQSIPDYSLDRQHNELRIDDTNPYKVSPHPPSSNFMPGFSQSVPPQQAWGNLHPASMQYGAACPLNFPQDRIPMVSHPMYAVIGDQWIHCQAQQNHFQTNQITTAPWEGSQGFDLVQEEPYPPACMIPSAPAPEDLFLEDAFF